MNNTETEDKNQDTTSKTDPPKNDEPKTPEVGGSSSIAAQTLEHFKNSLMKEAMAKIQENSLWHLKPNL